MFNLKLETKGITQEPGLLQFVTRVILILMTIKSQIYNLAPVAWPALLRSAMQLRPHHVGYLRARWSAEAHSIPLLAERIRATSHEHYFTFSVWIMSCLI